MRLSRPFYTHKIPRILIFCLLISHLAQSCSRYFFRNVYEDEMEMLKDNRNVEEKPYLKAHFENGNLVIFQGQQWRINTQEKTIQGHGRLFDMDRKLINSGELSFPVSEVALFETNAKLNKMQMDVIGAMTIMAALDVALGIFCLSNPKACFGSCPTFYLDPDTDTHYADAEGFSHAVLPSMEYTDLDALRNGPAKPGRFSITMKNEALETHCVNRVWLMACPRKMGESIYHDPSGNYYRTSHARTPSSALSAQQDVLSLLHHADGLEWFVPSDPEDLLKREEVFLTFDDIPEGSKGGLVVSFRQSLLSTYLFYSSMDWMGDEASDFFAKMETNPAFLEEVKQGIPRLLGDIEVYQWNNCQNEWEFVEGLDEKGPIAVNHQIIALRPNCGEGSVKIRISLARGYWRLDQIAWVEITGKPEPMLLSPVNINHNGKSEEESLRKINSDEEYLITLPGDQYRIDFNLPEGAEDYELFISSKGYYLEWMRKEWMRNKNLANTWLMLKQPKIFLKTAAADYKQYESMMEDVFWNSRIDTEKFSYYED